MLAVVLALALTPADGRMDYQARCGMCFAHNWQAGGRFGYGSDASAKSLRELRGHGVGAVSLTPFGWMHSTSSSRVVWDPAIGAGESHKRIEREAARARELGFEVMLKPHIWIRGGEWRGDIDPGEDWPQWLSSYRAFILEHARLAERIQADWLCMGVELVNPVKTHPKAFTEMIGAIRKSYSGKVTYCANWDRVEQVELWPHLDAVSVQMFAPLVQDGKPPTQETLTAGATKWLHQYESVATRHKKPLMLTEVGYMNRVGTAARPWEWPERVARERTSAGDQEQANAYRAILDTFGRSPQVSSLYFWKWFTDANTNEETDVGFWPRGKPAADVLRARCVTRPADR